MKSEEREGGGTLVADFRGGGNPGERVEDRASLFGCRCRPRLASWGKREDAGFPLKTAGMTVEKIAGMTVGTSMTGRGGHLSFSLSLRERVG